MVTTEVYPEAARRLDEFATLPPGWDTYDAQPIAARALDEARRLLAAVGRRLNGRAMIARPFFVAPLPYGGVQIEWRRAENEIEVEIAPDGRFGYLSTTGEGENRVFVEKDDASTDEVIDRIVRLYDDN
ncbi:MAG: hypothetical protein ACR2JW_17690 [Thermomicrobiales bacterium]